MIDVRNKSNRPRLTRRAAGVLAAVAVGAVGLLIPLGQAVSASPAAVSGASPGAAARASVVDTPVTTTAGKVTLTVDPASGLTSAGATLKVTGKGFDTANGLYVAICHADGKAPASLRDCVGGAIPDSNTTTSWAHVSKTGAADPGAGAPSAGATPGSATSGGPVTAKWGDGGSFGVNLNLPPSDPASDALDCARVACALYTRPDAGAVPGQSLSVPLVYAAAPTTSPGTTTTSPTTSTPASTLPAPPASSKASVSTTPPASTSSIEVPRTVHAEIIRAPTVVAGGAQEILFAGFRAGEPVTVTLYSVPRPLPAVKADPDGVVKVGFTVPTDLEPGTHLLRVDGQTSKVTGVASFVVTAIPAKPSVSTVLSSVGPSPSTSATVASSSAPVSSAIGLPVPLSSVASSTGIAAGPVIGSPGKRLVWPWYALGILLALLAVLTAVLLQRRRNQLAAERQENDALLREAAAAEHQRVTDAIAQANANAPTSVVEPFPGPSRLGPGRPGAVQAELGQPEPGPTARGYGGPGGDGGPGGYGAPGGYAGYHPGEHGLLSGRDHPDSPGLLSGTGYRRDEGDERPTTYLPGESFTGSPPRPSPDGDDPARPRTGDSAGGEDVDQVGGPPTGTWTPDFDASADGAEDQHPEADDPSGGGRHSR